MVQDQLDSDLEWFTGSSRETVYLDKKVQLCSLNKQAEWDIANRALHTPTG